MADSVYKVIELIGTSTESWEKAAEAAVAQASQTVRNVRIAEGALLAPARCCLKNIGQTGAADEAKKSTGKKNKGPGIEESLVERAFAFVNEISQILKDKYSL